MNRLVRAAQSWWEPEHHDDHEVKDSAAAAAAQAREDRAESLAGASSSSTEPEPQPEPQLSGATRAPGPPRSYTDAEKQTIEAGGGLRFVRSTISAARARRPRCEALHCLNFASRPPSSLELVSASFVLTSTVPRVAGHRG